MRFDVGRFVHWLWTAVATAIGIVILLHYLGAY